MYSKFGFKLCVCVPSVAEVLHLYRCFGSRVTITDKMIDEVVLRPHFVLWWARIALCERHYEA